MILNLEKEITHMLVVFWHFQYGLDLVVLQLLNGYQIFSKENCADLESENIKNYYNHLINKCIRRERLLTRYAHLNDRDAIVRELIADTQPNFSHPFYWNIGHQFVKQAKELWNDVR